MAEYPKFDFVMTNPPFYSTVNEASAPRAGDKRCRTDMSTNEGVYNPPTGDMDDEEDANADGNTSKSGGGGDVGFITSIMNDSQHFKQHVSWYTVDYPELDPSTWLRPPSSASA